MTIITAIYQNSETYPTPTVINGIPTGGGVGVPWQPSSTNSVPWASRIGVVVQGANWYPAPSPAPRELTFFRNVPCEILTWSSQDPFGDASATIRFPSITSFDIPGTGDLDWLAYGVPVDLFQVNPAGTAFGTTLFEGQIASWEDAVGTTGEVGMIVTLVGAMFQFDWYIAKPTISFAFSGYDPNGNPIFAQDIGRAIYYALTEAQLSAPYYPTPNNPFNNAGPIPINFLQASPGGSNLATGIYTTQRGQWDKLLTSYVQTLLSQAQNPDGSQWTILLQRSRQPILQLRDFTTVNWTVHTGGHGIAHDLSQDVSQTVTVIYGQGTTTQKVGIVAGNANSGVTVSGAWANEKFPTLSPATYQSAYYAPLAEYPGNGSYPGPVEPWTYDAAGNILAGNPNFNSSVMRVERYEQMGQQVSKAQGIQSAQSEINRLLHPVWTGTITLTADPIEGSRFTIQAGQNIKLRYFHGTDVLFHISKVDVDFPNQTVALTVASAAVDAMTLAAMWARDNSAFGTQRSARPSLANLNISSSTTTFDTESGAGQCGVVIPSPIYPNIPAGGSAVYAPIHCQPNSWTIVPVPFGEYGQVALTWFQAWSNGNPLTTAQYAIGVFSGPIDAGTLTGIFGSAGPLTATPAGNNPWNDYATTGANGQPGLDAWGLLYGAGGPGTGAACGFYPADPNATNPTPTGVYLDAATWTFAPNPTNVPWCWVALWAQTQVMDLAGTFFASPGTA